MPEILLLTETELRHCITLDKTLIDVIEQAFARLAEGEVIMPPVLSMDLPKVNGEVDVKTAYIPDLDSFTIKISPGFFDNPSKGLPSLNGLMISFASDTGLVQSVLLDNGYLTDLRTAAAGAVAARHLAPPDARVAGIVGAGLQAQLQAQALLLERDIQTLYVWARNPEQADAYAREQSSLLGINVVVSHDLKALVERSQVVITTTPAREALIKTDWLHPGLHITAMGSDAPDKHELEPSILTRADHLVVDRISQSRERGEMRAAIAAGILPSNAHADELGELCSGHKPGRQSNAHITVCDLTGTGVQDTAIADHATRLAIAHRLGTRVSA